jgi:hypothetical protein
VFDVLVNELTGYVVSRDIKHFMYNFSVTHEVSKVEITTKQGKAQKDMINSIKGCINANFCHLFGEDCANDEQRFCCWDRNVSSTKIDNDGIRYKNDLIIFEQSYNNNVMKKLHLSKE